MPLSNLNRPSGIRTSRSCQRHRIVTAIRFALIITSLLVNADAARAFTVTDATGLGLGVGRWDAAHHSVDGLERSLDGGLRFSLEGGSYEAYRDLFQWDGTPPTVSEFQSVVEESFRMWEEMDPATGLGTDLRFVPDFSTPVFAESIPPAGEFDQFFKLNRGAEIDLFAAGRDVVSGHGTVVAFGDPGATSVTLTSGVSGYPAAVASGMDLYMSTEKVWTLHQFLNVLSHEVGHVVALADVDTMGDTEIGGSLSHFYDDNYDDTNATTVRETLNNSFAHLIDPFDPDNSPALSTHNVCYPQDPNDINSHCAGAPGIDTPGADLKMETSPNKVIIPLQNDDFAGRQFLYPFVRVPGDFNADKSLTAEDIDLLTVEIRADEPRWWFDANDDGSVTTADREFWVSNLKKTRIGDSNLDGEFGSGDLVTVFQAGEYEDDEALNSTWATGDWNGDGDFDTGDMVFAFQRGGYEKGPLQAANTVPEPSPVLLTLMAFAGFMMRRRK